MDIPALDVTWLSFLAFLESQNSVLLATIYEKKKKTNNQTFKPLRSFQICRYVILCDYPHSFSRAVSILGLPGTTLHNPCSPICVAVGSLHSTHSKSGNLLWSWCNSRPDSWHKSQLSSTDPHAWLQPQPLPVGQINWCRLLIVFNVHPYLNHSDMQLSRKGRKKRI